MWHQERGPKVFSREHRDRDLWQSSGIQGTVVTELWFFTHVTLFFYQKQESSIAVVLPQSLQKQTLTPNVTRPAGGAADVVKVRVLKC